MSLKSLAPLALTLLVLAGADASAAPVSLDAQAKDFPATAYAGPVHQPDFKGRDRAFASFRTRIREGIKGGPNFAGHMALITFGCGAGCVTALSADVSTGKVTDFPLGGEANMYLNLAFDKSSSLVTASWMKDDRCMQEKLVWDGSAYSASTSKDIGNQAVCDKLSGL